MTDAERREVAAKLRELAEDYKKVPAWSVLAPGELPAPIDDAFMACGIGRAVHATEICGRLADLIEPGERTCERGIEMFSHAYPNEIVCDSDCVSTYVFPLTCGHEVELLENKWPSYCPHCGARVVADD